MCCHGLGERIHKDQFGEHPHGRSRVEVGEVAAIRSELAGLHRGASDLFPVCGSCVRFENTETYVMQPSIWIGCEEVAVDIRIAAGQRLDDLEIEIVHEAQS